MDKQAPRVRASFLNRRGINLALKMLDELETVQDGRASLADECQLEGEYRWGKPFRNIVAERLRAARDLGPEAEEGFCMILSHIAAMYIEGWSGPAVGVRNLVRREVANG